jgi:hypothetical protein
MRLVPCAIVVVALSLASNRAQAGVCGPTPDVLLLQDRSGTMKELVGGTSKWNIAMNAIQDLTTSYQGQINFGLMLFPRWPHVSNCSSGKINVSVGANTSGSINNVISATFPLGDTPLALTLDEARTYLQQNASGTPQYVILITDGKETCSPDEPGSAGYNTSMLAAGRLLSNGVKTYVVGFGTLIDPGALTATAQAGGTGSYFQADDLGQLKSALNEIAAQLTCCGDGVLNAGEICDTRIPAGQFGACPTYCNDGNPCTEDLLIGSGCNTACSSAMITSYIDYDGCCPPGGNSALDKDCAASCGNGVLDAGEKCDTGIPSSHWGGCPSNCDDGDPCTTDSLNGSGCQVVCSYSGSCQDRCGNGVVDWDEWCDIAVATGAPGACPSTCNDGDSCTDDQLNGFACKAYCTHSYSCGNRCGNGVWDWDEDCDIAIAAGSWGSCVTSCNDSDPCTTDSLQGSGCQVYCIHQNTCPTERCGNGVVDWDEDCDIALPAGSSGACPFNCNDGIPCTDDAMQGSGCHVWCTHINTCSEEVCGNGVVDPGEWCDVNIAPGAPGACPVSCFDDEPCTRDEVSGTGCLARCIHLIISQPFPADGCCPPGANGANDSDCSQTCGNGVKEPGETCDPGILAGPDACAIDCDDHFPCTVDYIAGEACRPSCVHLPATGNPVIKDGCCPTGLSSLQDADCLKACGPDDSADCVDACQAVVCPDGQYCASGQCLPWPNDDGLVGLPNSSSLGGNGGCDCSVSSMDGDLFGLTWFGWWLVLCWLRRRSGGV